MADKMEPRSMMEAHFPSGTTLGPYVLQSLVGSGGMGEVYRARDDRLGRNVAIKVLPAAVGQEPKRVRRFDIEARATAALSHPNILAVYDSGWHEGAPYLVTELLEGEDLSQRLGGGTVTVRDAVDIAIQTARALSFAHDHGVVHRDLKPGNLFLARGGHLKVLDFGLARMTSSFQAELDAPTETDDPPTSAGTVLGTVGYMSPEQVRGEVVDGRADIFSLGVVLYELLAKRQPFARATGAETLSAVLRDDPPPLPTSTCEVSPALEQIIGRCLAKRPEDRFQSAHDLALALEAVSSPSWPETAPGEPQPNNGRAIRIAAVAAVVVLALIVGATVMRFLPTSETPASSELESAETPSPRPPQNRVVVLPFVNKTGDPGLDPLSHSLAAGVWRTVADVRDVDLVPMATVDSALESDRSDPASAVVEAVNAGVAVSGTIFAEGDNLRLQAVVQDIISGHVRPPAEVVCPAMETMDCLDRLSVKVAEIVELQVHVPDLLLMINRLPSYEAYRAAEVENDEERGNALDPAIGVLRRLYRAYNIFYGGESDEATAMAEALLDEHDSLLTETGRQSIRGARAVFEGNIPLALRLFRKASDLEPSCIYFKGQLSTAALIANRPLEIIAVFEDVAPCDSTLGWKVVRALLQAGDFKAVVEASWTFRACFPDWSGLDTLEVMALAALGRVDEMEMVIERSLSRPRGTSFADLIAPAELMKLAVWGLLLNGDQAAALSLSERALATYRKALEAWQLRESAEATVDQKLPMVEFLWRAGLEEEAVRLGSRLLESAPENREVVMWNGILAARRGERVEAEKAAAVLAGAGITAEDTYNLACIAAQLGDADRALDLLRQTPALGWLDLWYLMRFDPDMEPLRDHPAFQEMLRPKG